MNTFKLVRHHSLSLAYTSRLCVGMLEDFDTGNPSYLNSHELSNYETYSAVAR